MIPSPPLLIAVLALLLGAGALGWALVLDRRLGKARNKLSQLERQATGRAHDFLGLSREMSHLQGELTTLKTRVAALASPAPADPRPPLPAPVPVQILPADAGAEPEPDRRPSLHDLIAALNAGEKAVLRELACRQLDITKSSEDAIQMGRTGETRLEEVSGGGSYLGFDLVGEHWLLPTERTLEGYTTQQPLKGIFRFQSGPGSRARLLQAARLNPEGEQWSVAAPGEIEVPG